MSSMHHLDAKLIIRNLKGGVFPQRHIEDLTLGRDDEQTLVYEHLRQVSAGGAAHLFVEGTYGSGKSHFMKLIESIALRKKYAVLWMTFDGYEHAFNHPARYLSRLLDSLRIPNIDIQGIKNITLHALMNGNKEALSNWERQVKIARYGNVISALSACLNEEPQLLSSHLYFLACEDCRAWANKGRLFYPDYIDILKEINRYVQALGCEGLVILFDEIESVVKLLGNVRSILLACELFQQLSQADAISHGYVVFGTTPDFGKYLASNNSYFRYYNEEYPDGVKFANRWVLNHCSTVKLDRIPVRFNKILCKKIMAIHESAYNWRPETKISTKVLDSFCNLAEEKGVSIRALVKAFVNLLEVSRQYRSFDPSVHSVFN